jgi:hypothetical protein
LYHSTVEISIENNFKCRLITMSLHNCIHQCCRRNQCQYLINMANYLYFAIKLGPLLCKVKICTLTSGPMSTQTPLKWILICILPHPIMLTHVQQLNSLIQWPYRFVKLEVPTIDTKTKVLKQHIHTHVINNWTRRTDHYMWTGWVWEITDLNSKTFQKLPTIL